MRRCIRTTAALVMLMATLAIGSGTAWAHGQSVSVDPASARPGDTITIVGKELGGNRDVGIVLMGMGKEVVLGTTKATPQGEISAQMTLPAELAPGSYQLRAKGKEDADADLAIMPAMPSSMSMSSTVTSAAPPAAPEFAPRDRSLIETAALVALFGVLAGVGLFFARTAHERVQPARVSTPATRAESPA